MADIEHSVAACDIEIERRTKNVKDLEICIFKKKLKICNREKENLIKKLNIVRHKLQGFLKILNDYQTELNEMAASSEWKRERLEAGDTNKSFNSRVSKEVLRNTRQNGRNERLQNRVIKNEENQTTNLENQNFQEQCNKLVNLMQRNMQDLQKTIGRCDHDENGLEEMLYSTGITKEGRNEFQGKELTTKDEHVCKFNCNLQHTEHLESEIKWHEKSSKEKDEQISDMKDQVQQTLKKLHQTEAKCDEVIKSLETKNWYLQTELGEIKASLLKKTRSFERDIENRDLNVKHLENQIDNINSRNEELLKTLDGKDKQLSEERSRYQSCLDELHAKYEISKGDTVLLKERIQHLEKEKENRNTKIKVLEEIIENNKTDIRDTSEQLYKRIQETKERDDQLSELSDQLQRTLNQMNSTESELGGVIRSQSTEIKKLKAEEMQYFVTIKSLEDKLDKVELKMNDNNKKQGNQLDQALKRLREQEKGYDGTMTSLKKENQCLKVKIEDRDLKVNELEEMLNNKNKELERCSLTVNSMKKELKRKNKDRKDIDERFYKIQIENNEEISKLKHQLQQNSNDKDAEMRKIEISLTEKRIYLESEIKLRDRKVKYLEDIISSKKEEINEISKRNKLLESTMKDNNYQLQERKDLEEQLKNMKYETNNKIECLLKEVKLKEEQLSERTDQLKQALKQLHEKEADLANTIASQNKLNKGQNDKISELVYQQQQTLDRLDEKETELQQLNQSFMKKIEHLQSELDRRDQKVRHLEELLNKETDEMSNVKEKNEFLETKEKQNDAHIRERSDQLNQVLKKLQETEKELGGALKLLKKQNQGLGKKIENRDMTIKQLENELDSMRIEMNNERERFEKQLREKDKQLSEEKAQSQENLKETNTKLGENILSLENQNKRLQAEVESRDLNLRSLEKLLNSKNAEITEKGKFLAKEKDTQISELRNQLQKMQHTSNDREAVMRNNETAHCEKIKYFESEVERREQDIGELNKMLNKTKLELNHLSDRNKLLKNETSEKETQVRELSDQVKCLQEKEMESKRVKATLEKEKQSLVKDIECYDARVKDLEENMKTEICRVNEHLVQKVKEKDQQVLKKSLYEKEVELGRIITSLRNKNQELHSQLSKLRDDLNQTLKTLADKDDKIKELDNAMKFKSDLLKTEVGRREQTIRQLNETVSSKNVEITQLSKKNEILENEIQGKDDQLRGQEDQLRQNLKDKNETEYKLDRTITSLKEKIEHLQAELYRRDRRVKDLEEMLHDRKIENISNSQQGKDVYEKEQMITELKNQLQQTLTKLRDTETELDEVKTRLSKAMGDRLTDNNPNITDLSDKNRPTKLAERFAELYDNQWTDAFDILDKCFETEENIIEVLLLILLDAMTFCKTKAHEQMKELGCVMEFSSKRDREDQRAGVRKLLKDCRKAMTSDSVAAANLYKMYMSHLSRLTDEPLKTAAMEVVSFSKECLEICWFMVIQDPAVVFAPLVKKGSSFNTDMYKPYTKSGSHVDFVVWPPLLLHEAGPILAKGVAQGYGEKTKTSK